MPNYNIEEITPGTTFSLTSGISYNLSGFSNSLKSLIKEKYSKTTGILSFTSSIVESGNSNTFKISLTSTQTSGLSAGVYIYEVLFLSGSNTYSLLDGYLPVGPFSAF